MYNKILIKFCCIFTSVVGDVATEFKWYGLIRNPRVSFRAYTDSEAIKVDETFIEIHAEQDDEPASLTRPGMDLDPTTNMDLLLDDDNDWASQGFEHLNRRPSRSQQPRFTNPQQLARQSCFF